MSEQLSLLGGDEEPRRYKLDPVQNPVAVSHYSLFFAIFPDPEDAKRIANAIEDVRKMQGIAGKPMPADRLHISLHAVAEYPGTAMIPQSVVDAACSAAARVMCPPLSITFDRAALFENQKAACVFQCDKDSAAQISPLRNQLGTALRQVDLHPKASSQPHMTMLYGDPQHAFNEPIKPLSWTATRFALILSHWGANHHQWVAQWKLSGPQRR